MGKDVLKQIITQKKQRIEQAKAQVSLEQLQEQIAVSAPTRPFLSSIVKKGNISLIAELKKASASAGLIRQDFDHRLIAQHYQEAGAQALSVLTEEDYFQGNLRFLREVRDTVSIPVLRKDFILEKYQVYESRVWGADAILLIAGALSRDTLSELMGLSGTLGMECLVEVHSEKELKKILKLNVPLIGINNRDLHTLEVDLKTTERLFPLIGRDKAVVVESGITRHQDVLFLKILGVHALLIGSVFMASSDIRSKVAEVMGW